MKMCDTGLIMISISYFMIGFRMSIDGFLGACMVCIALEITAVAMGLMFAASSPSYPVALAVSGPLLTIVSLTGE
jgi:hypothetical protein